MFLFIDGDRSGPRPAVLFARGSRRAPWSLAGMGVFIFINMNMSIFIFMHVNTAVFTTWMWIYSYSHLEYEYARIYIYGYEYVRIHKINMNTRQPTAPGLWSESQWVLYRSRLSASAIKDPDTIRAHCDPIRGSAARECILIIIETCEKTDILASCYWSIVRPFRQLNFIPESTGWESGPI